MANSGSKSTVMVGANARLRLKRFRIRNYKSCIDSQECWLSPNLTILAGKNESGKTAVLEGLDRIYNAIPIAIEDRSNTNQADPSTAEITFELNSEVLDEIEQLAEVNLGGNTRAALLEDGITLFYCEGDVKISSPPLDIQERGVVPPNSLIDSGKIESVSESLTSLSAQISPYGLSIANTNAGSQSPGDIRQSITGLSVPDAPAQAIVQQLVESIVSALPADPISTLEPVERFLIEIKKRLPRIIFFSDQLDMIPYDTPLTEALTNPAIQRLARIANLDLEELAAIPTIQSRKNLVNSKTATLSNHFRTSWLQEQINIAFDVNAENLLISFIEEDDKTRKTYRFEQRSKGFQWFAAFYARLEGEPLDGAVVLIDEPGLYLHAKAQRDLLAELMRATDRLQVLFSTHSPYMIDAKHLHRVRTVTRDNAVGTRVNNKLHTSADLETVTPILTAIGDQVGSGINNVGLSKNVVLEGPSDPLHLRAMAILLDRSDLAGVHYIGCMGADNVPQVCSILHGWGMSYIAIVDNDAKGRGVRDKMAAEFSTAPPCALISAKADVCMEDLYSAAFFDKYILVGNRTAGKTNSHQAKVRGDKVIMAKVFLEKIEADHTAIEVDDTTRSNFTALFDKIAAAFA